MLTGRRNDGVRVWVGRNLADSYSRSPCSVNDAVNVLGRYTWAHLNGRLPELRSPTRTTLAFRPPSDYGSGGWGFEILAARSKAPSSAACQGTLSALRSPNCDQAATTSAGRP
jgi:hypothetical protein